MIPLDWLLFLLILLTIGKCNHASFLTGCNPVYCLSVLDSLFNVDGEDSCVKAAKLVKCASPCFPSENVLMKGLKVIEENLCSNLYQEDSYNANKCLSKQKYDMFSCFYKFYNSEAEDPVDPKFLSCKISMNIGICEDLNIPCTSRASYLSETLLHEFYVTFLSRCFGIDHENVKNIHMKSTNFKEYGLLAECLDKNSNLVTQCFSKAVAHLSVTSPKDVCRTDVLTQCIEHIVLNACDNRINFFRNISQSLANRIAPFCSKTKITELLKYKNTEISTPAATLKTNELSDVPKIENVTAIAELSDDPETENVTENAELSSLQTPVSSEIPITKDLSVERNNYKFHTTEEINSDFLKRVLKNATAILTNNTVLSSNSTPPIVVHKHIVMTVSYRAKSGANAESVFFALIGVLCLIQYLSTGMLIQ